MKVFCHHLYEFKKGLRKMILHTTGSENRQFIEKKLQRTSVDYIIYEVSSSKINVFFGKPECVEVIRRINKTRLNDYTHEEDFILGAMLGYICRFWYW